MSDDQTTADVTEDRVGLEGEPDSDIATEQEESEDEADASTDE